MAKIRKRNRKPDQFVERDLFRVVFEEFAQPILSTATNEEQIREAVALCETAWDAAIRKTRSPNFPMKTILSRRRHSNKTLIGMVRRKRRKFDDRMWELRVRPIIQNDQLIRLVVQGRCAFWFMD